MSDTDLDLLFNRFVQAKKTSKNFTRYGEQPSAEELKCGLGLMNSVVTNINRFSIEQQLVLNKLLLRPTLQTSIVSISGKFRIHFDTTGYNVPVYDNQLTPLENAIKVAEAADSAYNYEVTYLGFLPPPGDNGTGGDDLYDIYIISIPFYGETTPEDIIDENNQTYTSYIDIHPEFGTGFYTHGINAMRVTVAHELHHAIQVGSYTNHYNSDGFFYELTSTSMEEFVFDDVNDYYDYCDSYFHNPETSLPLTTGYNSVTWNIFLKERFGSEEIIKRQWELMPSVAAMYAISNSLFEQGTTFRREFNRYAKWMFYSNYRAIPGRYFEEAAYYPDVEPTSIVQFDHSPMQLDMTSKAAAHTFIKIGVPGSNDSLVVIITNGDVQSSVGGLNNVFDLQYTLYNDSSSGSRFLTENYSSNFIVSNPSFWSVSEILNNLVVREDDVPFTPPTGETFAFPNPFSYSENLTQNINFSFNGNNGETVDFNIYTSAMNLVYSKSKSIGPLANNSLGVKWNVLGNDDKKLNSGVYIYVIKNGNDVIKGKIVIFN